MKRRYLSDLDNWRYPALALAAGYALGLFGWQVTHQALLPGYLYENQLSAAERYGLLAWLAAGMIGAVLLWLAVSVLLGKIGPRLATSQPASATAAWLTATARLSVALLLLPFLPLLAISGIETEAPLLVFCMVIAMSALAAGGVKAVLALRAQLRGQERARWLRTDRPEQNHRLPLAFPPNRRARVPAHRSPLIGLAIVLTLAAAYALFMSVLTVGRHNAFGTNAFDLGIHSQSLYTIALHGYPRVTLYGPDAVNQFSDHFAPIFYLLTPLYTLFGDARALLVLQSIVLASGVAPVYLLARRKLASQAVALALAASYLLFPALHGVNNFDFHEIALVVPLLLWSLYFLETGRFRLFGLFLALALFTKEEVALTGVAIGLYILFVQRQPRRGALVTLASAAYFALVVGVIMPALGGGADVGRFDGLEVPGFSGFAGVAVTVVTNPIYTFDYALLDPDKLFFLAQLLLPVLGIPLLAGLGPWIVAVPGFATLLLSSYRAQYLLDTHYSAIVIPSIFFLAVLGLARMERWRRVAALPLAAALLTASLLMNWQFGWLGGKLFSGIPQPSERHQLLTSMIDEIPPHASVSTQSNLAPHLANREQIYLYPNVVAAEYILFDTALDADYFPLISRDPRGEAIERLLPFVASGEYGLLRAEDGMLLLQRGFDPANNQQALRALGSVSYDATDLAGAPTTVIVQDPAARSGRARLNPAIAELPADPVPVVFGPYATLIPGRYRVDFRLKLAEQPATEGLVGIVDVFSYAAGGLMAQHGITAEEFAARDAAADPAATSGPERSRPGAGRYHSFTLELQTDRVLNDVEFRVGHTGRGALAADTITVEYLGPPGQ